jgi:hypothetical protein
VRYRLLVSCLVLININARKLYAESKLGNIFVSNYFAKTHSSVLVSCALHPGVIKTDVSRHMGGFVRFIIGFFGFMAATPA